MSQDWALSMLAAEVAADQRCALQRRLRHQLMEAGAEAAVSQFLGPTMLTEGAAEAEERHNSV